MYGMWVLRMRGNGRSFLERWRCDRFDNEDFGGAIAFWDVRGAIVLMMRVLEE
jgi:hypothetical protein